MGPKHPHSDQVHAQKYRGEGESFREAMNRIAAGLADDYGDGAHYKAFREALLEMRFMPAGRIQAAIGSPKHITPYNCFVSGTIHDSFVHGEDGNGRNSIMDIARQAAQTMRMGGGIGYDWSTLRPENDLIRGVQSRTGGLLAFMPINDAVCQATSSAGNRRGAQMGVLRIDHPDVRKYVLAKQPSADVEALWELVDELPADWPDRPRLQQALQKTLRLTGFNLSLAVTDEFMECLETGRPFPLRFAGRVYNEVDPAELWETVMRSTWDWGDPGVLFIDTINRMNNLWYCEEIAATNPCGEQPLPPYGACLLGSFNLTKYLRGDFHHGYSFDWELLRRDIPHVVRAMDNVVDYAAYPLPEQEREAKAKRRMGLGVTGLANCAEALGHVYGSPGFLTFEGEILRVIRDESYRASVALAREKGPFPLFDETLYGESKFIRTLPEDLQADIRRHGIRNSHLTSIAPTGTISYAADNVSSSIEPVFEYEGQRIMNTDEGQVIVDVHDYGVKFLGVRGKVAKDVTAREHVAVLGVAAAHVDSAVSKTCNVAPDMAWGDFKDLYRLAYDLGAKGCTTFNAGGRKLGIFLAKAQKEEREEAAETVDAACTFDPASGRRSCE